MVLADLATLGRTESCVQALINYYFEIGFMTKEKESATSLDLPDIGPKVLFLIGFLLAIYGGYRVVAGYWYQSTTSSFAGRLEQAGQQWATKADETRAALETLRNSSKVRGARLEEGSDFVTIQGMGPRRLQVYRPGVETMEPSSYPAPGFQDLALMLNAKDSGEIEGPAFSYWSSNNREVAFAMPLFSGRQSGVRAVRALVLVGYEPSEWVGGLEEVANDTEYFYIQRRRGDGTLQQLTQSGELTVDNRNYVQRTNLANTNLRVGYALGPLPFASREPAAGWPLVILGALLLAGALAWKLGPAVMERRKELKAVENEDYTSLEDAVKNDKDEDLEEAMDFAKKKEAKAAAPKAKVPSSIFRAYDIRGVVGKTLTADIAIMLGRAIGSEAIDRGQRQIVVARDGRKSGPMLVAGLIEGLTACGVDVIDIGAVPTGMLYYATHSLETGSGVMVTGSHNPPEYNGFKIMLDGETLAAEAIKNLEKRLIEGNLHEGAGGVQEMDLIDDYVERIAADVQLEDQLKVVVDCGNGIPAVVAPLLMEEIGCDIEPLYCEVDGDFPNHHPDPSDPANLQDLILSVKQMDADLGIAFDGDGDRLGVVTKEGEIIYPDRLLTLFAQDVLTRNPGAVVIYDVKCTGHLARVILNHGGSPIMWKTGHSLIKGKMKETDAALAGEMSGHFFFKERWYGFDDGLYAAARLLEILAADGREPSEIFAELPNSVSTPELKIEMKEGEHYEFIEEFKQQAHFEGARITDIDGIRADYDDGWGLVRCSNTTPCLVLRFDADSAEALERIKEVFREQILAMRGDLKLPF